MSNLSCPDDEIVKDSIYFEAPRVSEDASSPIAFPSTVTSPDMPGHLEVETMRPNQATSYDGRQEQVTDGVRLRRDTPQQLTSIMDFLHNARMQSYADQSTITSYQYECADLKQQLHNTTEEKNRIFRKLKDKTDELRTLRYQDHMTESGLKSDAESEQAKTEQLEEKYKKLQEHIFKCEQEKKNLLADLQTFRSMESYLLQQIDELREEVRKLTGLTDRRFCCATLLSHKRDRQFILRCAVFVGSAVSCVVFILLSMSFLAFFYFLIMHRHR